MVAIRARFEVQGPIVRNIPVADAPRVRLKAKNAAGKWTAAYVRSRIQKRGLGAGGQLLKGYSTRPVRVSRGMLKKIEPPGGLPKYYPGGYTQYRQEVGLQTDHFAFTNTGASFRGFRHDVAGGSAGVPIDIGFSNSRSHVAAMYAVERDRPEMFGLDERELDKVFGIYLDSVVASAWRAIFQDVGVTVDQPSFEEQ